jgi:hypothetical protein
MTGSSLNLAICCQWGRNLGLYRAALSTITYKAGGTELDANQQSEQRVEQEHMELVGSDSARG